MMKPKYFGVYEYFAALKWLFKNETVDFEKEFAGYIGAKYAIGTSYGRTALYLGLKSMGVDGKEVILPAFTCTVVRHAVLLAGAKPRFVDIQFGTFDFDVEDLKNKITPLTKAVVVTHYFGGVANNLEEVIRLCREKKIAVIEDCAHSLGAEYKSRKIGSYGDFAIYSLTKSLINFGGGVLVTNDDTLFCAARNILKKEKTGRKRRIADFPLVLSYGLEQMVDKLLFDRVGKSILKWWTIKVPSLLLVKFRNLFLISIKKCLDIFNPARNKTKEENSGSGVLHSTSEEKNPYPLEMNRITASVGRYQLKKLDSLILQRKDIYDHITPKITCTHNNAKSDNSKNVFTNVVLRMNDVDIVGIVNGCKQKGLLLRATWPTHQALFSEQQTKTVEKIKNEILVWNVSPMLKEKEINRYIELINSIPEPILCQTVD